MTEMTPRYLFEIVSCLFIGVLPGCATATDPDLPASGDAARAGASAGGSALSTGGADAVGGAGASTSGGATNASSGGSMGGTPAHTDGGATSSAGSAAAESGGASATAGATTGGAPGSAGAAAGGAPAGGAPAGGAPAGGAIGVGGSATGGAPAALGPWTFDSGVQGWAVRDHTATITTMPTSSAGVVAFTAVPFSAASQYTDFALSFSPTADLTGHSVHAKIRRVSGGFIGAQVYAYGGAWVGSAFTSLTSATFVDVALPVAASSGFDPAKITRIGIKFNTGSNAANTFSATTLEVDSVTIQ